MSDVTTNSTAAKATNPSWRAKWAALDKRYDAWCQTEEAKALSVIGTGVLMLITAIVLFGYPALIFAALTAVPVIFFLLLMITVGK